MKRITLKEVDHIFAMIEEAYQKWNVLILEDFNYVFFTRQYFIKAVVNGNAVTKTVKYDEWELEDYQDLLLKLTLEVEKIINPPKEEPTPISKELIPMICPMCGGSIKNNKCEYCDTKFR